MNLDQIRELGKDEIGWERHKMLTGEGSANTILHHWVIGFLKSQGIVKKLDIQL